MTAPRLCRSCGAELPLELRWCTLCFTRVTEFAPRPVTPIAIVDVPHHDVRTSRWQGGEMTFGPVGRLVATALVLLMGPWTNITFFTFVYAPIWLGVAAISLRHIWRRQELESDAPPTRAERFRQRHPSLGGRINGRTTALVVGVVLASGWLCGIVLSEAAGRFVLIAVAGAAGLAAFIAWITDV